MSPRQWIALAIALIAAVGALFAWRAQGVQRPPAETSAEDANLAKVLVATRDIAPGVALTTRDIAWVDWPRANLGATFITQTADPKALENHLGAITRAGIVAGEPVFASKVALPGQGGAFAALLDPGRRAVAVPIEEKTAAAGFISPNDRVDVLLTRTTRGDSGEDLVNSELLLQNVRVLAIGRSVRSPEVDPETGPAPIEGDVATLDLSRQEATVLAAALESGRITLALRGYGPEPALAPTSAAPRNQATVLRVHAFGEVTEITGRVR